MVRLGMGVGVMSCLLLGGCMTAMARTSSGLIGCPAGEIEISDYSQGYDHPTWTATCRGEVYYCSNTGGGVDCTQDTGDDSAGNEAGSDVSARTTGAPTAGAAKGGVSGEPPSGAGGFDFGIGPDRAREQCEAAGFSYTGSGEQGACAGTATPVGFDASARLRFCHGKLCFVVLESAPDSERGSDWTGTFTKLTEALTGKYGEPTRRQIDWPSDCRDEGEVVGCLRAGRARFRVEWDWGGSRGIVLAMGKPEQGEASIRLSYSAGAMGTPEGL